MAINQEKIKTLLGQGLSVEVVASVVGCTPSYISQLMSQEAFSEEVAAIKANKYTAHSRRDDKLDEIEEQLIDNLKEAVDSRRIVKPAEVLSAFKIINGARRRNVGGLHGASPTTNVVVNLQLPTVVMHKITTNSLGEVIAVGDQTLNTITPQKLLSNMKAKLDGVLKIDEVVGVQRRLPQAD